ncbi:sortase [uncultured Ruminococcus sp.]|uniref:sortase n=1 Tax=uncultured Ruminococcus sp. TaxID=165186 RepID=UPI00266EB4AD|nr:sortase [uncultured Ruminococcus sp.]
MKNTRGLCWILAGAVLLAAALSLCLYNWHQSIRSGETAQEILTMLKEELPPLTTELPEEDLFQEYGVSEPQEETVLTVYEYTYIGILTIPSLGIELPVQDEWSYPNLKIAPCRYAGTVADGNLIVAAHNYRSHFGRIGELNSGDEILFTECSGAVHTYEVVQTDLLIGTDVSAMAEGDENWDLTLFTCTLSGQSRVTVRAAEKKE